MAKMCRVVFSFILFLLLILIIQLPVFGQTSVIVEVRVLELSPVDLEPFRISPTSPSFARALSKEMEDYLRDGTRSKPVHRVELQATSGNATQLGLDSRVISPPRVSSDPPISFDVGIGFEVTPTVFHNRDILLSTVSQVRIRRGPEADGGFPVVFKNPDIKFETRIQEGVTVILGGFITDAERSSLPALQALPDNSILNYLYSKTGAPHEKGEIIMLLTPRIVGGLVDAAVDLPKPVTKSETAPVPAVVKTAIAANPSATAVTSAAKVSRGLYSIQIGAFENLAKAEALVAQLSKKYDNVFIDKNSAGKTLYHVRVGRLPDMTAARKLQRQLAGDGFDTYLITPNP